MINDYTTDIRLLNSTFASDYLLGATCKTPFSFTSPLTVCLLYKAFCCITLGAWQQ